MYLFILYYIIMTLSEKDQFVLDKLRRQRDLTTDEKDLEEINEQIARYEEDEEVETDKKEKDVAKSNKKSKK